MEHAFSLITLKSVNAEQRRISGIATTPTMNRMDQIVVSEGARFKLPIPLHLYHNDTMPVGNVDFARPRKTGIPFEASLPIVNEPGIVQDRVNEALHSLKYRLLNAVSIGFLPDAEQTEYLKNGSVRFNAWEWVELSLVSIPAQPEAVINSLATRAAQAHALAESASGAERQSLIQSVESIDRQLRAASGQRKGAVYLNELSRRACRPGAVYLTGSDPTTRKSQ